MRAFLYSCDVLLAAIDARNAIHAERGKRSDDVLQGVMRNKALRWTKVHQPSPLGYATGRHVWRLRWRVRTHSEAIKALDYPGSPFWCADAYKWNRELDLTKIINLCRTLPGNSVVSITPNDFSLFKDFYEESKR